jgi:bifunctional UDP-N-acetylglucosamine pyrophosphorylase/glucosamine-1-phosphate N-acetyltransferase
VEEVIFLVSSADVCRPHSTSTAIRPVIEEVVMVCDAVILAAGLGTRMKSDTPKVLHTLGERPILTWVVDSCREATQNAPIVVVGPDADEIRNQMAADVRYVVQEKRLGTGHATLQARDALNKKADLVLIVNADLPLIEADTLKRLISVQEGNSGPLSILSAKTPQARGFGRILRSADDRILGVIEAAHATPEQLAIEELNVGAYAARAEWLWDQLSELPLSPKGEYYLTDLVMLAAKAGQPVGSAEVGDLSEVIGINNRLHLAEAEAALRTRINRRWMLAGVTLVDPQTAYIGPDVEIGNDTLILPNTHLQGKTVVGSRCRLGPNTILRDTAIGNGCEVTASVLEGAVLEDDVDVGPFAHLRSGARLCRGVHMGNFGEVKNSTLKAGVKMGHFSYVGDTMVGESTNIGAGTITCNYDGERKHPTEIGAEAFIGSDTMLVAPVKIGAKARTGAGSVVTRDVPDGAVAVGVPARVVRKPDKGE